MTSDTRPRRNRRAMRVLLVDADDRILLFRDSDLGLDPVARFWITPGGGVDPGETDLETVVREVAEETGYAADPAEVVGPLAVRRVVHGYSDVVTTQDEVFWFLRTPVFTIDTSAHTLEEQTTMTDHRWWTRAELESTTDEIWPVALLDLWDLAATPPAAPLDLGVVEESTVPA